MKYFSALFLVLFSIVFNMPLKADEQADEEGKRFKPFPQDMRIADSTPLLNDEQHIVIITCSYNNALYYQWNLNSILTQEYTNYHVIYIDDLSIDGTSHLVKKFVEDHKWEDHVILIENEIRRKALANLYYAISLCKSTDIIVILDGDDRFANAGVLKRINQAYANPNIWLTFGQFREHPSGGTGFCRAYPKHIIDRNGFRYYPATPSHLRTFYAGLFHKIKKEDLMFQGDFFPMTYDLAIMYPMIEMSRTHHQFIGDILVDYNNSNPLSDHRVGKGMQRKYDLIIRARTCYTEVKSPF